MPAFSVQLALGDVDMPVLDLPFIKPLSFKLPVVVRYLEKAEFVEAFFATGALMLTTYSRCQSIEDAVRRDPKEGHSTFAFDHGGYTTAGIQQVGKRSYMLCGSMIESAAQAERFGAASYIRINDPLRFAEAVSRWIPGCQGVRFGPCIYRERRETTKATSSLLPPVQDLLSATPDNLERTFNEMNRSLAQAVEQELAAEPYFLKEADPFAADAEFRFVWTVPYDVEGSRIVECPDAIPFCQPGHQLVSKLFSREPNGTGFHVTTMKPQAPEAS